MHREFIVLDIETTGFSKENNEIIEIGAIKVNGNSFEIIDKFSSLISIEGKIPNFITSLTGITNEMLSKDGNDIKAILKKINLFVGNLPIYAHNSPFDKGFIRHNLMIHNIEYIRTEWINTIKIFKEKFPNRHTYKLDELINDYGISDKGSHRAISDVEHTLELLKIANTIKKIDVSSSSNLSPSVKLQHTIKRIISYASSHADNIDLDAKKPIFYSLHKILSQNNHIINKYKDLVKHDNKTKVLRGYSTPFESISPIEEIALTQMIEYYFNKSIYGHNIKNIIRLKTSNNLNESDFFNIACEIYSQRNNDPHYEKNLYTSTSTHANNRETLKKIKLLMALAQEQVKFIQNKNVIFSPSFKNWVTKNNYLIINNILCKMIPSPKPSMLFKYKLELISYILLNEISNKPYEISLKRVLYWNPLLKIFRSFEITITDEMRILFKHILKTLAYIHLNTNIEKDYHTLLEINEIYFPDGLIIWFNPLNVVDDTDEIINRLYEKWQKESLDDVSTAFLINKNELSKNIKGKCITFTGKLRVRRSEMIELITANGAEYSKSITTKTNLLVVGEKPGSKYEKANEKNIKIISEEEFQKLCR